MAVLREGHLSENNIYAQMMEARKPKFPCPKCGEKCAAPKDGCKCECKCGKKFTPKVEKLTEGVTSSNSVHGEIEAYKDEFMSGIQSSVDAEATEAKLTELEKIDLTTCDKKIIGAIRKFVDALAKARVSFDDSMSGLKFEFVVSKKAGGASGEEESEAALTGEDENLEDAGAADEVATPVEK
jgi:hypothetical protein